jgi:hypothetical protein
VLAPVLLLLLVSVSSWSWWGAGGGGAHPGGAHEPTGDEAEAVDVAEHQSHELTHQFLHHHPHSVLFFYLVFLLGLA